MGEFLTWRISVNKVSTNFLLLGKNSAIPKRTVKHAYVQLVYGKSLLWSYCQSQSPTAVHKAARGENVAKASSSNSGGHCSSSLLRRDSDVQLFDVSLQESGHILQKFSDAKKLSVSNELLRFPTTFTSPERKHMLCTQGLQSKGKQDSTESSFSERLTWLESEIKLPLAQRRKVAAGSGLS